MYNTSQWSANLSAELVKFCCNLCCVYLLIVMIRSKRTIFNFVWKGNSTKEAAIRDACDPKIHSSFSEMFFQCLEPKYRQPIEVQ